MKGFIRGFGAVILLCCLLTAPAYAFVLEFQQTIPCNDGVAGLAAQRNGNALFAIDGSSKALSLIDLSNGKKIKTINLETVPSAIASDVQGQLVAVASADGTVHLLDPSTGVAAKAFETGRLLRQLAIHETNGRIYAADDDSLMALDPDTGDSILDMSLPGITALAVDPRLGIVLAAADMKVYLLEAATLLPIAEIASVVPMSGLSVNPSTHIALLTSREGESLIVLDIEKKAIIGSHSLAGLTGAVTIDPGKNIAYIATKDGIAIVKLENPTPQISSLVPKAARSGDSGFMLAIEGSKFITDSQPQFNQKDSPGYFRTNELLQSPISAIDLTRPGDVPVIVTNPPPGGGTSNTYIFKIYNPAPVLESVSPEVVPLAPDSAPLTLRAYGRNFFNGSTINLNGEDLKTRFISSILLEAERDKSLITRTGEYPVVVINPSPGGFTSNPKSLTVVDKGDPLLASANAQAADANNARAGVGSLRGRIVNTNKQPVDGVTIQIKNLRAETDEQGYFLMENIPSGKHVLIMHGSTARELNSHYPTIPITVDIRAGIVNEMPFQPYLHRQKNRNFKHIEHDKMASVKGLEKPHITGDGDAVVSDPELPGVELKIPKGVKITGWDGKPNRKVSMRTVPSDRLPVKPLPDNAFARTVYMFYFDKVGGGTPDSPIPFKAPNDIGLLPGEKAILYYYDESPNEGEAPNDWAVAGTGTVSSDGRFIVSDPGVGMPKFCCGAAVFGGSGANSPGTGPPPPGCGGGGAGGGGGGGNGPAPPAPPSTAGDPVDLATGYFLYRQVDYSLSGTIPVHVEWFYRSGSGNTGGLGPGNYFGYDWWVGDYTDMLLLLMPGNYQYRFYKQVDGTFINTSDPEYRGDIFYKNTDSTYLLRKKNGWNYKFASNRLLIEIKDPNGNLLSLQRNGLGNVTKVTTPEGRTVTVNVVGDYYTQIVGSELTVTYNKTSRLNSVTYSDGRSIAYEYDTSGRMTKITENGKVVVINEYDANSRVIRQTHADGGVYTFSYIVAGGFVTQTTMTEPNGAVTTWRFNSAKYITEKTTPDGTTTYTREPGTNRILSITDPLGRNMTYTYDIKGRVSAITDPAGTMTTYAYEDVFDKVVSITDALGNVTSMTYDGKGNLLSSSTPDNKTTTFTYNAKGKPLTVTDPLGNVTRMEYDAYSNLTKVTDPLGNPSMMGYDSLGRMTSTTDARGNTTAYEYGLKDKISRVTDALGGRTNYTYDTSGNLSSVVDAKGHIISYNYDVRNRVSSMTDQLGKIETYTYDTSDNLTSKTDRKGQITTYQYDLMNRMTRTDYADGSYTTYTYDQIGKLLSITDSVSGTISYTYTGTGCGTGCSAIPDKVASETTPLGTINYTYDAIGRRTSMTVTGQPTVNYGYDTGGRMNDINTLIGGLTKHFTTTYDASGRRSSMTLPNGVTTNYGYDNGSRLLNMAHKNSVNQVLESLTYTYDQTGNRTGMNRPSVTLPVPGVVTSTSHNDANQMLAFNASTSSARTMTYDNNGNMTTTTNACGTTNYTWDARNRLVGINGFNLISTSTCNPLVASFKYDALGRRIAKTINSVTTQYVYDGLDIVQEKQNGVVTANYIRTMNIDEPLARIKSDGTVRYYQTDALGSVIALTDENGIIKTTYAYDPFGNTTITGEASDNPFQYTGRENDGTGLYYYRARYYSPELQRFISEDPIGLAGGDVNFYAYVGNSPINYTDPMGLFWPIDCGKCVYYMVMCSIKGQECREKQCKDDENTDSSKLWRECIQKIPECQKMIESCGKCGIGKK